MRNTDHLKEIYAQICEEPHVESHRRTYLSALPDQDPRRRFIELQLEESIRSLQKQRSSLRAPTQEERWLNASYAREWSTSILEHTSRKRHDQYEYDRGFIAYIECGAQYFMDHSEQILSAAPIRHIRFDASHKINITELLSSPYLKQMESINFSSWRLELSDLHAIASCENLNSCTELNLAHSAVTKEGYAVLAEGLVTRRMCHINVWPRLNDHPFPGRSYEPGSEIHPILEVPRLEYISMPFEGRELEEKFGYIPWLHPRDNAFCRFDHWLLEQQGVIPARTVGSPVNYILDPEDGNPVP